MVQPDKDDYFFSVHEVHYEKDGTPYAYSKEPASVAGSCIDDLTFALNKMKDAILNKPVLWANERFPEEFDYDKKMK
jgi:hypothetical protein